MAKHCLIWKRLTCKNVRGEDFDGGLPEIISLSYRGRLLAEIANMPKAKPILFQDAVRKINELQVQALQQGNFKICSWYEENFVQFFSDQGFHIEVTGDEFVFHLSEMNV